MLNPLCRIVIVFLVIAIGLSLPSHAQQHAPPDPGQYVLFIHAGPASPDKDDLVRKIAIALAQSGYVVRAPDQQSKEDGPGVDFFDEKYRSAAEHIASVVNEKKGAYQPLKPRLQLIKHPDGYIDVWLF